MEGTTIRTENKTETKTKDNIKKDYQKNEKNKINYEEKICNQEDKDRRENPKDVTLGGISNINVENEETSNSCRSSFKDHLFWPEPIVNKKK